MVGREVLVDVGTVVQEWAGLVDSVQAGTVVRAVNAPARKDNRPTQG